jgi:hypothetical protein
MKLIVYILVVLVLFKSFMFCLRADQFGKKHEKILFDSQMILESFLQTIKRPEFEALTVQQQLQVINGYRLIYEFFNRTQFTLEI